MRSRLKVNVIFRKPSRRSFLRYAWDASFTVVVSVEAQKKTFTLHSLRSSKESRYSNTVPQATHVLTKGIRVVLR
jgi:hypothetical protein